MHRGEARAHQRDVMGERGEGCCQAKRGFWSSGPGACLSGNRSLGGKRVSATDMHQGAGGLGGSSPAPWPQRLRHMAYLTPPPSSQQRRRRRKRERLVPETVQQGGRSHSHTEASGHLETLTDRRWGATGDLVPPGAPGPPSSHQEQRCLQVAWEGR